MSESAGLPSRRGSPVALFGGDVPTLLYSDPRRGGDGRVRINPDKERVSWNWIAASLNGVHPFTIPTTATRIANLTIDAQGDRKAGEFEASTLLMTSSVSRVAVTPTIYTPTLTRQLSNVNIESTLMFGTSQLPGLLPQSIFCMPKTSWRFLIQNLGEQTSVAPVVFGRRFDECGQAFREKLHRRAEMLQYCYPFWIGPQNPGDNNYTGPEFNLAPGQQAVVTFPVDSNGDFLMLAMLDGSTYTDGSGAGSVQVTADVTENVTKRSFINLPSEGTNLGLDWVQQLACPTVSVTGFPAGGLIRAFSLRSPRGCWGTLVPRNTQVVIRFRSAESANTITLRVALFGYMIQAQQPPDRHTSNDGAALREREIQAREFLNALGVSGDPVFATGPVVGGNGGGA